MTDQLRPHSADRLTNADFTRALRRLRSNQVDIIDTSDDEDKGADEDEYSDVSRYLRSVIVPI